VTSTGQDRARLLDLLRARSYRQGRVILASGKESDFYIDCRQTSLSAEGHLLIGRLFLAAIEERFPGARAVGGPTLGADPLVSAVSLTSALAGRPLDGFLVRKQAKGHGTGAWIEGMGNLSHGTPVVMIEDVVTSGGSLLEAISHARQAGLDVLGALVLVDREEGGRQAIEQADTRFAALFTRGDFVA